MRDVAELSIERCRGVYLPISEQGGSLCVTAYLLAKDTSVRQAVGGGVARLANFYRLRGVRVVW